MTVQRCPFPGAKCMESTSLMTRHGRTLVHSELITRGVDWFEARHIVSQKGAKARDAFERRCRSIAALHAKAREARRMARFLAWLREERCCSHGLHHCEGAATPEEALITAASNVDYAIGSGPAWVARRFAGWFWLELLAEAEDRDIEAEDESYPTVVKATKEMVCSPEWWDLPWQAEPVFTPMTEAAKEAAIDRALAAKGGR